MATLYFDCFSGASGDMILGALIDAGVSLDAVRGALGSLAIHDAVWTERVDRAGITATKFCVRGEDAVRAPAGAHERTGDEGGAAVAHGHATHSAHDTPDLGLGGSHRERAARHDSAATAHAHGAVPVSHGGGAASAAHGHGHRTVAEIATLIEGSALSRPGKDRAKELFTRLGEAEAAIHGVSLEAVHLHEVGALDSIIDIVGSVFALEALGVRHVVSSPLNVGSGTIESAHGLYPVPAPATLRLLQGVPVYAGPQRAELVTPTGALIVSSYAERYGPLPAMRPSRIGYGAGTRNPPGTPNVLRVVVGEADDHPAAHGVVVLEAEIDDMNPQIFGVLMERLLAQGALDVYYTPIQMKKNRPGTLLTVLAVPSAREAMTATIFRESTTIGVRYREMMRECLARETVSVETALGPVRVKVARRHGEVMNAAPEFDDCVRLAAESGRPVKDVQAAAIKAFLER